MKIDIFLNTGLMLYPLIILCFAGGIVFFERVLYIHKVQINVKEFISGIKNLLIKDRRIEALTICEETGGAASNLVKVILLNYEANVESIIANLRKKGEVIRWSINNVQKSTKNSNIKKIIIHAVLAN